MRSPLNSKLTIALLSFAILCCLVPASLSAQEKSDDIVVAEGTEINVVTAQEITSKTAKPNDPVNFTVAEDLVINGQVVVKKGTAAVGSVINSEKGGYLGKSGKLGIQVESTQSADGQPLKLRAAKGKEGNDKTNSTAALSIISPLFLFKKGGEAKIAADTPVTVYVAQEKRFRVDGSTLLAWCRRRQPQPIHQTQPFISIARASLWGKRSSLQSS